MKNLLERAITDGVQGFLHCNEAQKLADLATEKDVLEIGAFMGLSAYCMATTAWSVRSIDTFAANSAGQEQMSELTTLDAYKAAVARFPNVLPPIVTTSEKGADIVQGDFDMVFLDAMHSYEEVLEDIRRWWPRVRKGGVFAMHDYGHHSFPGVKQAADEFFGPDDGSVEVTLRYIVKE